MALLGTGTSFTIAASPGSQAKATVSAGQTATYNLSLTGTQGFAGTVTLTCTDPAALSMCTITPSLLSLSGTNIVNATVNVTTTAKGMVVPRKMPPPPTVPLKVPLWLLALTAVLASTAFALLRRSPALVPARLGLATVLLLAAMLATMSMLACAGGSGAPPKPGTPEGTYNLTVTTTVASGSATLTQSIMLTLTVN